MSHYIITTTYYFTIDNAAHREVIATDGIYAYSSPVNSKGVDIISGVNIYDGTPDDVIGELQESFDDLKEHLSDMDEIINEHEDDIYP